MSLVIEDLFRWVLVLLIDGCSADHCDLDVFLRAGELRVFLLCHLGPTGLMQY